MKRHATRRGVLLAALAACAALTAQLAAPGRTSARPVVTECEGEACSAVTLAFDGEKGQYRAQNNSSDRWVKVTASNLAASASACLAPGRQDYLALKSVVGPYRAEYVAERCGSRPVGD